LKRILFILAALVLVAISLYALELAVPKHDYFGERAGTIKHAQASELLVDDTVEHSVLLTSSSGLAVDMRVTRPAVADGIMMPLVILLGGQRTGKDAVDLVGQHSGIAFAAIDYPYTGPRSINGFWQSIRSVPAIQQAFIDAPPALSLALTWALQQEWVDPDRIELVGVSLGVPFAAVAGAVDPRFTRVWLLHGGGDNVAWVDHAARRSIENDTVRRIAASTAMFLVYGNSFDTPEWIAQISPRPVVIVAACDDDFVPREAQLPLVEAAAHPDVELIWMDGQHIKPGRSEELQQLLGLVTGRIVSGGTPQITEGIRDGKEC